MGAFPNKERMRERNAVSIKHVFTDIGHFFTGLPRDVFGANLLGSGWGIAAALCFSVVVLIFLIGGWNSLTEWAKAADAKWDKERIDADNAKPENRGDQYEIDWRKARLQQVVSWQFSVPFAALVLASLAALLWWSFNWTGYVSIGVAWFVFAPLLRIWWIRTVVRANRSLNKHQLLKPNEIIITGTTWQVYRYYMAWGLAKKRVRRQRRIFRYRFRKFNFLFHLLRLDWIRMRLLLPLLQWLFYVAVWPLAMVWSVFELTQNIVGKKYEGRKRFGLKPAWANDYADPPSAAGLVTETLPDDFAS